MALTTSYSILEKQFDKKKKELEKKSADLEVKVEKLEQEIKEIEAKKAEVENTLRQSVAADIKSYQERIAKLDEEVSGKKTKIQGFKEQLEQKGKEKLTHQEEIVRLGGRLVEIEQEKKELTKWKEMFPEHSPEEVAEELRDLGKKLGEKWTAHEEELKKLQKDMEEAIEKAKEEMKSGENKSTSLVNVSQEARQVFNDYVKLGAEAGQKTGLGLFLSPVGSLIGTGFATAHSLIGAGVYVAEQGVNAVKEGVGYAGKVGSGAKELVENVAGVGKGELNFLKEKLAWSEARVKELEAKVKELEQEKLTAQIIQKAK